MLIPIDDVLSLIPVSRATLYREMQRNDFPKPVRMGRRVMWDSDEIASWVESRKDLREVVTVGLPTCTVCEGTEFKAVDISGYLLCAKCSGGV